MKPDRSTYLKVVRALRCALTINAALALLTEAAQALTGSAQATVRLLAADGGDLIVAARTGAELHFRGPGRFRRGEGLIGWSAASGQAVRVNDPESDPRFQAMNDHLWTPTAVLVAPLLLGSGEIIGVLSTARRDGNPYSAEDLLALELLAELAAPHVQVDALRELSETDPLTRLFNRRHLEQRFPSELENAVRRERPLSLIMLDLDHFGQVNKTYGHSTGDDILREMAKRLRSACRSSDVLFRWGGEEFVVLLPETNVTEAVGIAERVLAALREAPFETAKGALTVTASAGVATVRPTDSLLSAQDRADKQLQKAKQDGRDQVQGTPA
jgi:diguanylate cyclase (GGDEF)-like protein